VPAAFKVEVELPGIPGETTAPLFAFRWTTYDVPFWARPNTRPGRWHSVGDGPTQYWSLSPHAAWAELIRHEHLEHERELDQLRMPLWVARVQAMPLVDLRDADAQAHLETTEDALLNDDWSACQRLGRTLRERGAAGLIAPCAALPEAANLTLFGPRRAIEWRSRPVLASTVPATISALGRPSSGLIGKVRFHAKASRDTLF
jgi:RES domain-containing protein